MLDEDGSPLAGVGIYIGNGLRATTDQEGRYSIATLAPGNHRLIFRTPLETRRKTRKQDPDTGETFGYPNTEYYPGTADPQAALPVAISPGLELRGYDVRLRRVRLVDFAGRTVERAGGEPLNGARVELRPNSPMLNDETFNERTVASGGTFQFDLIQPGSYTLLVYRGAGSKALPYAIPFEVGKTGIHDLNVAVPPFPTIAGSITAPPDTDWAGQIRVGIRSTALPTAAFDFYVTSEKFAIEELPPGRWSVQVESNAVKRPNFEKLHVKAATFGTQSAIGENLTVTESGNPPLEIQLTHESGRISGTAFDADGLPLKRTMILIGAVTAADVLNMFPACYTKEDGTFISDPMAPGSYRLLAIGDGRIPPMRNGLLVEVKAGETIQVRLTPPPMR